MTTPADCLFCRIARGEVPARMAYQDDELVAFHDIRPAAPLHLLLVPRRHIENLYAAGPGDEALLGRMLVVAAALAREHGCPEGFRVRINNGRLGGQEVYHLHLHVLGEPGSQ